MMSQGNRMMMEEQEDILSHHEERDDDPEIRDQRSPGIGDGDDGP